MEITEFNTSITFEPETSTYWLHHDWRDDESVTTAVVAGVAAVTNTPPTELDPLFETVDPDALEQLYAGPTARSDREDGRVSFPFNDCVVVVHASGTIEITPAEPGSPTAVAASG